MPGQVLEGKGIAIGTARLEGAIVALIREWAMAHLEELTNLERMVKNYRFGGGGTPGDNMMHMAEIPVSLHRLLKRQIDPDWIHNYEIRRLVLRNFTVGCVNRNSAGVKGE